MEILALHVIERFQMSSGRMTRLGTGDVETSRLHDHANERPDRRSRDFVEPCASPNRWRKW